MALDESVRSAIAAEVAKQLADAFDACKLDILESLRGELEHNCGRSSTSFASGGRRSAVTQYFPVMDVNDIMKDRDSIRENSLPTDGNGLTNLDVSQALSDAVTEAMNDDSQLEALPESLFSYCTLQICHGPRDGYGLALLQLIVLCLVEFIVAWAFSDAVSVKTIISRWADLYRQVQSTCFYQGSAGMGLEFFRRVPRTFLDIPWIDLVAGPLCVAILATSLRIQNRASLFAMHSVPFLDVYRRGIYSTFALLHTVVAPCSLLCAMSIQLAGCADVSQIVLSAFSAYFLVDLDFMMYRAWIGPDRAQTYRANAIIRSMTIGHPAPAHASLNFVCTIDTVLSVLGFLVTKTYTWDKGETAQQEFLAFTTSYFFPAMVFRCVPFVSYSFGKRECFVGSFEFGGHVPRGIAWCGLLAVVEGALIVMYMLCFTVSWDHLDYHSITSCMNEGNSSACYC